MDKLHSHSKHFNDLANLLPPIILSPLSKACNEHDVELGLPIMFAIYLNSLLFGIFFGWSLLTFAITMVYPIIKSIPAITSKNEDD